MKRINKIAFFCLLIYIISFCMFFPAISVLAQDNIKNIVAKNIRRQNVTGGQASAAETSIPGKVPGIEKQNISAPACAADTLESFNILKTVIINPATGQISFIGIYDLKYTTGAIPYSELLKEALESPYPSFSLGDINKLNTQPREYVKFLEADINRMWKDPDFSKQWINKILNLIMTNNDLKDDKILLVAKLSRDFGVTEEELVELYKSRQSDDNPTSSAYRAYGKMLNKAGYPDIGEAMASASEDTQEGLQRCTDILGISGQVSDIKAKMARGEISYTEAHKQVSLIFTASLMEHLNIPKEQVAQYANMVKSGQMSMDKMTAIMDEKAQSIITAVFGEQVLNNITLSQNLMSRLYPSCKPDEIELIFNNIPPNTHLAKIMYESDYSLKLLNGPSMVRLFPDQVGEIQFHAQRNAPPENQMLQASMMNRYWLTPGSSSMKISPDKKVISFGDAKVKINEENIRAQGSFNNESQKESIQAYAAYLSDRYELYASKIPSFHELREALKILALARWLKSQNIKISIPAGGGNSWTPPKAVTGRLYGVFTVEDHRPFFTVAIGGVDFTGDDRWINADSEPQVAVKALDQLKTSAYLGNKAAEAALNGDMENARALAEQSAQALTGEIDITNLQKTDYSAADSATPEQAELYKTLSKDANDAIGIVSSGSSSGEKNNALANLKEVQKIYQEAKKSPDKSEELLANYKSAKTMIANTSSPQQASTSTSAPGISTPVPPAGPTQMASAPIASIPPPPLATIHTITVPVPALSDKIFNDIKRIDPYDNPLVRFLDSPKTAEWIDAIGYQIKQIPSKTLDLAMQVVGLEEYYKVIKINKGLSEEVVKQMDLFMDAANKGFPEDEVKKLQQRNDMTAGIAIEELSGMPMPVFEEKESGWRQWFQKKTGKIENND